jgi:hypothetical protein
MTKLEVGEAAPRPEQVCNDEAHFWPIGATWCQCGAVEGPPVSVEDLEMEEFENIVIGAFTVQEVEAAARAPREPLEPLRRLEREMRDCEWFSRACVGAWANQLRTAIEALAAARSALPPPAEALYDATIAEMAAQLRPQDVINRCVNHPNATQELVCAQCLAESDDEESAVLPRAPEPDRVAELERELAIVKLSIPLEEELNARIDEMCKYLAMQDGFTLNGIARLFIECQKRMAADWSEIGRLRREVRAARARAEAPPPEEP